MNAPGLFGQQPTSLLDDPEYPELLRDMARIVARELQAVGMDSAYATAVAETVTEHVREHHGGVPLYWPKGEHWHRARRRRQMWQDFNGRNHAELARKYGMCLQQVYKWLRIARIENTRRTQRDMWETLAPGGEEGESNG